MDPKKTGKAINSLIRGELSAVETYGQVLEKLEGEPGSEELRRIETDHEQAVVKLRGFAAQTGREPEQSSGVWGAFASAVEGTGKVFGNTAALKALKEGEELGIREYEKAIEDPDLEPATKDVIRNELLPETRRHVPVIDRLMERTGSR